MSAIATGAMTQLTFSWPESDVATALPCVANPIVRPSVAPTIVFPKECKPTARSGKTQHISELLLTVLNRYGIDPDEFVKGLD